MNGFIYSSNTYEIKLIIVNNYRYRVDRSLKINNGIIILRIIIIWNVHQVSFSIKKIIKILIRRVSENKKSLIIH